MMWRLLVLFSSIQPMFSSLFQLQVGSTIRSVPREFLSYGLDSGWIRGNFCGIKWRDANVLGKALGPAYLRLGGNDADRLVWDEKAPNPSSVFSICDMTHGARKTNFTMNAVQWNSIYQFVKNVNWTLIFDLNASFRTSDGRWDPRNALEFLDYCIKHHMTNFQFELGNEPNSWHHKYNLSVTPEELAKDYKSLRFILDRSKVFKKSNIIGPSISNPQKRHNLDFMKRFLKGGGYKYVDAITFHHYYTNGRTATVSDMTNTKLLDSLRTPLKEAIAIGHKISGGKPIWLGETASAWGGGAPGLSDAYVAGFMYLDKLGLSAQFGLDVVVRQSFYNANYALIDMESLPNPDYWTSVLFKRLVGSKVLQMQLMNDNPQELHEHVRFYANSGIKTGTFTVYGMNLLDTNVTVQFKGHTQAQVYLLEPGERNNLKSRSMRLNGKLLNYKNGVIPRLEPQLVNLPFSMPAKSYAFFVINNNQTVQ